MPVSSNSGKFGRIAHRTIGDPGRTYGTGTFRRPGVAAAALTRKICAPFPGRLARLRLRAMTRDQMIAHLRAADAVARDAVSHGHHPFGAVLVGPDDAILMRQ